jgi:hypothetical protein
MSVSLFDERSPIRLRHLHCFRGNIQFQRLLQRHFTFCFALEVQSAEKELKIALKCHQGEVFARGRSGGQEQAQHFEILRQVRMTKN